LQLIWLYGKAEIGMVTQIKHFILLLTISLIPSEIINFRGDSVVDNKCQSLTGYNEGGILTRLSELKSTIVAKLSSENRDVLINYDDYKSDTYQKDEHTPVPYCIETSSRTINWVAHFRWNLQKLLADMNQKVVFGDEMLPFQVYSNEIFIPALTYYIYTLEEITI